MLHIKNKTTIGRKDKADFPLLDLYNIDIKIDTGAYTSSIHCHHIEESQDANGLKSISFQLMDPLHQNYNNKFFKVTLFKEKLIKNSFGVSEKRYLIETVIKLFGKEIPIELSLSERGEMKYPVLIGRKLLNGRFIVDTTKYNLSLRYNQKNMNDY